MKNQLSYLIIFFLAFTAMVSTSCKKDEDTKPKTRDEMLVGKKWQIKAATIDPSLPIDGGGTTTNLYNQFRPCDKDDFIQFNSNSKFLSDAGGVKCDVDDPQTIQGDWLFNADKTIVTLTFSPGDNESWRIISLSDAEMIIEYQTNIRNVTYTVTATWRPI